MKPSREKVTNKQLGRRSAYTVDPEHLTIIGWDTQHKEGEHPLWNDRAAEEVDEGLARNIARYGVINPPTVTRDGDRLLVTAGRRRVKASRRANEILRDEGGLPIKVPILIRTGDDSELVGIMISEDEQRKSDDMLIKARKAARLEGHGYTPKQIAGLFNVSEKAVQNWQKLLRACPEVQSAVAEGKIAPSTAAELAKLSKDEQVCALEKLCKEGGKPTLANAQSEVRKRKNPTKKAQDAPTKRLLTKLWDNPATYAALGPQASALLDWILGKAPASNVTGLQKLLEEVAKKSSKTAKK